MKKLIYILLLLCLVLSCKKEDKLYTISFVTAEPILQKDNLFFEIETNYEGDETLAVPLVFSGTAKKGEDYVVSADTLFVGKNARLKCQITPLKREANKEVIINFVPPKGFTKGLIPVLSYFTLSKQGYVSFDNKKEMLFGQSDFILSILDINGKFYLTQADMPLLLEVDTERSTAVEGVNFEFVNGKEIVFTKGSYKAAVRLKTLKYDKDKSKIVLRIKDDGAYKSGRHVKCIITIMDELITNLKGRWKGDTLLTTQKGFMDTWGLSKEQTDWFPSSSIAEDIIDFNPKLMEIIPQFKSELKNYFIGSTKFKELTDDTYYPKDKKGNVTKKMNFMPDLRNIDVNRFMLSNINRNFNDSSVSEDKEGMIGVHLKVEDNIKYLYLIIMDYKPIGIPEDNLLLYTTDERGRFNATKPTAHLDGLAVIARFKFVKDIF